jgi:hypothetical protein
MAQPFAEFGFFGGSTDAACAIVAKSRHVVKIRIYFLIKCNIFWVI